MTLRRLRPVFGACLLFGALALPDPALAQGIFLSCEANIEGEATAEGFVDWIEISSLGNDVVRATSGSKPQVSPLSLTKRTDRASPVLWRAAFTGQLLGETRIVSVDDVGEPLFELVLENAAVMSYSLGSAGGRGSEQLTLSFTRISYAYFPPGGGGTVIGCWDLVGEMAC